MSSVSYAMGRNKYGTFVVHWDVAEFHVSNNSRSREIVSACGMVRVCMRYVASRLHHW